MEKIEIITFIGIISGVCSILFGYVGYKQGIKKNSFEKGKKTGTIETDIDYIKKRIDDVLLEQRETNKSINALTERVARLEESTRQAHSRIDLLEKNLS